MDLNVEELLEAPFQPKKTSTQPDSNDKTQKTHGKHMENGHGSPDLNEESEHGGRMGSEEKENKHRTGSRHSPDDGGRVGRRSEHTDSSRAPSDMEKVNDERMSSKSRGADDGHKRRSGSRSRSRSRRRHRSRSSRRRRSRSRSRDRRRHRRRSRSRSRDSKRRRRSYSRSYSRERRRRDSGDRKRGRQDSDRRSPSPAPFLTPAEKDARTVFVTQLAQRLKPRELKEFFERAGRVRDARIVMDKITGRSKGVGYIEFVDIPSVKKALAMDGEKLLGIPVMVQLTESEKNRMAEALAQQLQPEKPKEEVNNPRLYVGSISTDYDEEDVRDLFEPYGPLEFVQLHRDSETNKSKGFAYIQNPEHAKEAMDKLNGAEIGGRNIRVTLASDKSSRSRLDEGDRGMSLSSKSRLDLMAKLSRNTDLFPSKKDKSQAVRGTPTVPATRCLLLKNVFNPLEETEPNWHKEIEEDVKLECSSKFGPVAHIHVDQDSEGHVYIKFETLRASQAALQNLNGRFFAGRQLSAAYVSDAIYNARFPGN